MKPGAVDVVTEACLCIKNTAVVLSLRASLWHYEAVELVVRAMRVCCTNVAVQLAGCAAIQNLAHDSRCKIIVGEIQGIQCIIKAMARFADNEAFQRGACGALYNMTIPADADPDVKLLDGSECVVVVLRSRLFSRSLTHPPPFLPPAPRFLLKIPLHFV